MRPPRFSTLTIALFGTAITLIGTVTVVIGIVFPTTRDIRAFHAELEAEQRRLEERYQQGRLFRQLRSDWEAIADRVPTIHTAAVSRATSVALITRLESVAAAHDIDHRLILAPDDASRRSGIVEVPFTIEWNGTWSNIIVALSAIEREPFFLPIDTILIQSNSSPLRDGSALRSRSTPTLPSTAVEQSEALTVRLSGTTLWKDN